MNITRLPIYKNAAEIASKTFTYGDTISFSWLYEQLEIKDLKYGTQEDFKSLGFELLQKIESFKNELLTEHLMHLENQKGQGYLIVHPSEQASFAMINLKRKMGNEMKKCMKILSFVNNKLLNYEDVKRIDEERGKIAALKAFSRKTLP